MKNHTFLEKLSTIYPEKTDYEICLQGFNTEKRQPVFRINILKSSIEEIEAILTEKNLKIEKVPFLKNGYKLLNGTEKDLWDLDIFTQGKIYLQSIASQLPVDLLMLEQGQKILDITAAPGGKTSQIQSLLNNTGNIIAIDNNAIRIDKLNFTLKRQGIKHVEVIKSDARAEFLDQAQEGETMNATLGTSNYFDIIIADLPCSAEGKFNFSREKSYGYWNESIPKKNAKLQKAILKNIVPKLKSGGQLVYSTCTLSPEENEDIIHFLLCNFPELELEKINIDYTFSRKGLSHFGKKVFKKEVADSVVRILPNEETEGFFIAKLRKK